ncbi:MAG: competence protein CoiA family protein [Flavobacteriales bacterium]
MEWRQQDGEYARRKPEMIHGFSSRLLLEAERDGELISIDEVDSGLACNCVCPACKEPLVARKGAVKAHHFAHHKTDCESAIETVLHLKAKEIISKSNTFVTPPLYFRNQGHLIFEEQSIPIDRVWLEKFEGSIKPDIIIESKGRKVFVEVVVTHGIDWTKLSRIRKMRIPTIGIDAKYLDQLAYTRSDIRGKEDFVEREIIFGHAAKYWVYNPFISRIENALGDYAELKKVEFFKYQRHEYFGSDETYTAYHNYVNDCPLNKDTWKGGKNEGKHYAKVDTCSTCDYKLRIDYKPVTGRESGREMDWPQVVHCIGHHLRDLDELMVELRDQIKNKKGKNQ